jgi:hypothetical protein
VAGEHRDDPGLDRGTQVGQPLQRLGLRREPAQQQLGGQRAVRVEHERSCVAPDLDLAHALQGAQRLAHRDPADLETFGQLPLRRHSLAWAQAGDHLVELGEHLAIDVHLFDRQQPERAALRPGRGGHETVRASLAGGLGVPLGSARMSTR